MEHLDKFESGFIIETGTAWDRNNWDGQGQSTLIWDWVLLSKPAFRAISIDITPLHVETARSQVVSPNICIWLGDSVRTLNTIDCDIIAQCRLLYLDSYDWQTDINLESAFHHMAELATVWPLLPSGCMIVVDDRHGLRAGKHWLVEAFMKQLGIEPCFVDYQIGWVKP